MGNSDDLKNIWAEFHAWTYRLAKEKANSINSERTSTPFQAILWQNALVEEATRYLAKEHYIIQMWQDISVSYFCTKILVVPHVLF